MSSDAQAAVNALRCHNLFRLVPQLMNISFPATKPLMNADGILKTLKEEHILIWKNYSKDVLSVTDRETKSLKDRSHCKRIVTVPSHPSQRFWSDEVLLLQLTEKKRQPNARIRGESYF